MRGNVPANSYRTPLRPVFQTDKEPSGAAAPNRFSRGEAVMEIAKSDFHD